MTALQSSTMKRRLRWSFDVAAAISLLLFVAVCVAWVWSFQTYVNVGLTPSHNTGWGLQSCRGGVCLLHVRLTPVNGPTVDPSEKVPHWSVTTAPWYTKQTWPQRKGTFGQRWFETNVKNYHVWRGVGGEAYLHHRDVIIPYWCIAAGLALLPAFAIRRRLRQRKRRIANRCANCGYDLRASPARCPECGSVPAL